MARPKKNEETEQLQVRIPVNIKKELKLLAVMRDTSMSQIVIEGFELYRKKYEGKKP
tara:strand:- start:150 stop:320 length:171 start_codon:yes stop_codon:yes gene_type:complete